MVYIRKVQTLLLCLALAVPTFATASAQGATTADFQELVAPIALYPDALVAQVLAASTYPTQVVEASQWVEQNSSLKGEALGSAIDKQPWDPSVKALAQFPSVLKNMSENLSWTSALGDAYFNAPHDVMAAVQTLRKQAESSGQLESTSQQTVTTEGDTIIIQPSNPEVVYVPSYSPEVYGSGYVEPYPGYSGWNMAAASMLSFGVGTAVGAAVGGGWGWGWNSWGTNWHGGNVEFNRNTYVSRSNTFTNRNSQYNAANRRTNVNQQAFKGNAAGRAGVNKTPYNRPNNVQNLKPGGTAGRDASRGYGQSNVSTRGSNNGAFGGYSQGGSARIDSSRGRSSFSSSGGGRTGGGRTGGGGGRSGGGRSGGGGRRR